VDDFLTGLTQISLVSKEQQFLASTFRRPLSQHWASRKRLSLPRLPEFTGLVATWIHNACQDRAAVPIGESVPAIVRLKLQLVSF
jgi:hypothetical protein